MVTQMVFFKLDSTLIPPRRLIFLFLSSHNACWYQAYGVAWPCFLHLLYLCAEISLSVFHRENKGCQVGFTDTLCLSPCKHLIGISIQPHFFSFCFDRRYVFIPKANSSISNKDFHS